MFDKMSNEVMAGTTVAAIIGAFLILYSFSPGEILLDRVSMQLATFVVLLSSFIMLFVLGTFMGIKHKKTRLVPKINVLVMLLSLITALGILSYTRPNGVFLTSESVVGANFVLSILMVVLVSVTGTFFMIRQEVFIKKNRRKPAKKKRRKK